MMGKWWLRIEEWTGRGKLPHLFSVVFVSVLMQGDNK